MHRYKINSDFEIQLSRSCEKCDEKFATEVDLDAHKAETKLANEKHF